MRKHNSNFHTQKRAQMGPVKESECFWLSGHNDCSRWFASKYLSTFSGFTHNYIISENVEFFRNCLHEMMKFNEIEKERKITKKSVENPQASCFRVFATFFYPKIWWNIMSLLNFAKKMEEKLCSKVFTMLKRFRV